MMGIQEEGAQVIGNAEEAKSDTPGKAAPNRIGEAFARPLEDHLHAYTLADKAEGHGPQEAP